MNPQYAYASAPANMPIMMASGGLPAAARQVQAQGRNGDSMLVHMTPGEVKGLQGIAMANGGSLSINPETGLPEANFLKSILPIAAGAALSMIPGVGPLMAAGLVGGGTALFTGSLQQGLMAGLGAFGGAGLAGGLGAAGAAATAPTVTGTQAGLASAGAGGATAVPGSFQAALPGLGVNTAASTAPMSLIPGGSTAAIQGAAATTPTFMSNLTQAGQGISALGTDVGRQAFMQSVGGPMGLATKGGAALAGGMYREPEVETKPGETPQAYINPYAFDFNRQDTEPGFAYRTGKPGESTAELSYFAPKFTPMGKFKAGEEPGPSFYGTPTAADYEKYSKPIKKLPAPGSDDDEGLFGLGILGLAGGGPVSFAEGGMEDGGFVIPADVVSHLGNGSNEAGQEILAQGLGAIPIRGDGDGMSDSIPTMIEGEQEARVADGEAYIPAEVVQKVGPQRLYDMMNKIRKARTGKTEQAPEIEPEEFVPA